MLGKSFIILFIALVCIIASASAHFGRGFYGGYGRGWGGYGRGYGWGGYGGYGRGYYGGYGGYGGYGRGYGYRGYGYRRW